MRTRRLMRAGALAPVLLLLLSGCATTTGGGGTDVMCAVMQPIEWSRADTDATIRQIKEHNAIGRELCGWR